MGVGFPETLKLERFGEMLRAVFGPCIYHVGSSAERKKPFRDVDVVAILDDETYAAMGFEHSHDEFSNAKWRAYCEAFSLLGRDITGLPVDFKIQKCSKANEDHKGVRSALGIITTLPDEPSPSPCAAEGLS